jgi:L-2-hydroxyglutarate oxidase LhgO
MQDSIHTLVVGAGIVGLAVARALALTGREVIVIEKNPRSGEETSARNSEVIHAGLYYPTSSLKAQLCVAGNAQLYAYCAAKGIAHRRCGKLVVASDTRQLAELAALHAQGTRNGVRDLRHLDTDDLTIMEPQLRAVAAILSPSTGILDSHALLLALQGDLEAAGGHVAVESQFTRAALRKGIFDVTVRSGSVTTEVRTRELVNAAGLHASAVAEHITDLAACHIPQTRFAKGTYFALRGPTPFRQLIYPLPEPGGLGIHATLDLAGRTRFGPDVEWLQTPDYVVDPRRSAAFYAAIRSYWPALPDAGLAPAYAGIRPKLVGPGASAADFRIDGASIHEIQGLVNLFGIESPGLTASLAIADYVLGLMH